MRASTNLQSVLVSNMHKWIEKEKQAQWIEKEK